MFDLLAGALAFFYDLWPSYGMAIALFTLCVMLVLAPLSIKSTRSMIAMQRVGPELKKLQQKHKDDRETLNREMMAFYKENNINPFSSCLPLLLQMPVFIVLYQVVSGLTRRSDGAESNFDPKYLEGEDTPLAVALRGTNEMVSFGMDLSKSALGALQNEGLITALPFILLVGIVVVSTFVQQRQVTGRNPNAQANPQQQMITKVLPFVFIPISISIPAGVVIYFAISNLVRVGQQALITRLEYPDARGSRDAKKRDDQKPPPSSAKDGKPGGAGQRTGPGKGSTPEGPKASGRGTSTSGNGAGARTANGARRSSGASGNRNRKRKRK